MSGFTKREQIAILLLVVGIISIIGYNVIMGEDLVLKEDKIAQINGEQEETEDKTSEEVLINEGKKTSDKEMIVVYISGQVHKPGVVKVHKGSRLYETLSQVGGLIEDTYDKDRVNLARIVKDEEKIYIPKIGEELNKEDITDITTTMDNQSNLYYTNGKININKAPKEVLIELSGIGEAIADEIIKYRIKNKFDSIEELQNISGIGEKKISKIRDLITIEWGVRVWVKKKKDLQN